MERTLTEAAASLLKEMRTTAARMRTLIVAMPAQDLLGYIFSQRMMKAMSDQDSIAGDRVKDGSDNTISQIQFLLEYVHAVLASDASPAEANLDEAKCIELLDLAGNLMDQAISFAMATSMDTIDGVFGPDTADIEFRAKSTWVLIRGNRYQVLEREFYAYALASHDDVLKEIYSVGAAEIAAGFQDMANAIRSGQADAIDETMKQFEAVQAFAAEQNKPMEEVMYSWRAANADESKAAALAMDDILRGGIANVSRHTKLPVKLLADLAYDRGEEIEFFAAGDYAGTPYRTLPARKKPLIKLGSDYYAVDPCFTRDAGYRALLFNLLQRKPDYKRVFESRQKTMSEAAFPDILAGQLPGAKVHQEVYYKDPITNQWTENDTLILIDDVLFLVEAKAGAAATIASPALDFERHAQSVQDLVLKAYKQCERFFNYINSADEVPIYHRLDGRYIECDRICRSDYRVMVPIGLTVESFSPFSAYCKELPQVEPLLGTHAFVSMSIDDLFVLKRLLPTPGEFAHYMEVRQAVAGIRHAHLFDEFDHLGAYLQKNRFDEDIVDQLRDSKADMLIWDGMSGIVDSSFMGEEWETRSLPTQKFPDEALKLLRALNSTRAPGWLSAESHVRNFGEEARKNLAKMLSDVCQTMDQNPEPCFIMADDGHLLFIWFQKTGNETVWKKVNDKASAVALAAKASTVLGILVEASIDGTYYGAQFFSVSIPTGKTEKNAHIYDDAARMVQPWPAVKLNPPANGQRAGRTRKTGRNKPCPCGSGVKYKKCHGR